MMHKRKIALKRAKRLMRNMIPLCRNNRRYSYKALIEAIEKATPKDRYTFSGETDHPVSGIVECHGVVFSLKGAIVS